MRRILLLAAVLWLPTLAQAQSPQAAPQWIFDDNPDEPSLYFGAGEPEEAVIAFSCEPKDKVMSVSAAVTSGQLRPGAKTLLKLSAGTATLEVNGDTVANETDAGGLTVSARGPVNPRVFALVRAGPTLKIEVPGQSKTLPLTGLATHIAAFEKLCRP